MANMAERGDLTSTKDCSDADFMYTCSPCGEDNVREEAVKFCPVCEEYLCTTCTRHHGRQKATRSHVLIDCDASISSRPKLEVLTEMEKRIPDDISNAILEAFKDDVDSCARILYFLTKSVSTDCAEPFIRSLQSVLSNALVFKKVAERMAEDTKSAEEDPQYRQMMYDVWNNFLKDIDINDPDGGQRLALAIRADDNCTVAQFCFMRAVSRLPPESFRALATIVDEMGGPVALYGGRAITFARKAQPVVRGALVTVVLAWNVILNIKRWWTGEITGVRCAKNIIDCGVGVATGIGGGIGGEIIGASVGSIFGPIGTGFGMVFGAVLGGVLATTTAESLCDRLTQWVFGLPKSEALENAYTFLGTSSNDSNSVVNSQYRRLALQYHPDKGGDAEKWIRVQYSMAVIREARGEP